MPYIYNAVWRPGTGGQWWWSGSDWGSFQQKDTQYLNNGYRIVSMDRRNGRYFAVWRPGSGAQWVHSGISLAKFKQLDSQYFSQGLRLVAIDSDNGDYLGVWRSGNGPQYWASGMSFTEFKDKDSTYLNQGLRLSGIDIDGDSYMAFWRPGTGAEYWLNSSLSDFKAKDTQYFNQGLRLVAIDRDENSFMGVWRPGSGAQWVWFGMTEDEFKAKDQQYFNAGLRLVSIDLSYSSQPYGSSSTTNKYLDLVVNKKVAQAVDKITAASFTVQGPNGFSETVAAELGVGALSATATIKFPDSYNPSGSWNVWCDVSFTNPLGFESAVNEVNKVFSEQWSGGSFEKFAYHLASKTDSAGTLITLEKGG